MDGILGFLLGLATWVGFVVAAPVLLALLLGLASLAWRLSDGREARRARRHAVEMEHDAAVAPNHTWVRAQDDRLRVGLDDFALRLLPGVSEVVAPAPGATVREGEPLVVLRLAEFEVPIASPVTGRIAARHDGALLKGWLVELEPTAPAPELKRGEAARDWQASECRRLFTFAERELGLGAADGGEVDLPSIAELPRDQWSTVVREFLKAEPRKAG